MLLMQPLIKAHLLKPLKSGQTTVSYQIQEAFMRPYQNHATMQGHIAQWQASNLTHLRDYL
jgi:hypothetical protein